MPEKSIFVGTSVHSWNDPRIFYKEAISMAKKYNVEIHAPADFDFKEEQNVKIFGLPLWQRVGERRLIRKLLFKRVKESSADVFHFHDPELIFLGLYVKLFKKKKVIYDIHEDIYSAILLRKWIPTKFFRKAVALFYSRTEKWCCVFFDLIIFAEQYYKELFSNKIKSKSVDILNFPIQQKKAKYKERNDFVKVIYTGNVTADRGAYNMIACLRYLIQTNHKIKLFLVGQLKSEKIISMIENDLELSKHIELIGKRKFVDRLEINKHYENADIGLVLISSTTHYERKLLTKFFEYMQHEIPMIISNFTEWERFIAETKCGICVDPKDPSAVGEAVEYLINNQQAAETMGKNGKKAIQEKYNWLTQEEILLAAIDSL